MDTESGRDEIRRVIGEEIRVARARRRLSQEELGARAGLSQSTINRLEAGKRTVDVLQLIAICKALGIDAGDLLDTAQSQSAMQEI